MQRLKSVVSRACAAADALAMEIAGTNPSHTLHFLPLSIIYNHILLPLSWPTDLFSIPSMTNTITFTFIPPNQSDYTTTPHSLCSPMITDATTNDLERGLDVALETS